LVLASVAAVTITEAGRVADVSWRFSPAWLVLAAVGFALLQLAHAELWRRLLRLLGYVLPGRRSRAVWNVSALARYVPTGLVSPIMRAGMTESDGVPRRVCLVSVVYELGLALTGALVVSTYALLRVPQLHGGQWRFLLVGVPVISIAALHPRFFHRVTDSALKRFGRQPLPLSVPFARLAELTMLYAASFVLAGLSILALVLAVHPVATADIPYVLSAHAFGFSASVLGIVLPGGLGAREAALAAVLTLAVPTAVAVAVAVAARVVQLALEIAFAAITPVLARGIRGASLAGEPGGVGTSPWRA
jgi:glycosyltransferase 2 family protein